MFAAALDVDATLATFYKKTKGEDNEEFENVNAVARPAATKMRKAKLSNDDFADDIENEIQENSRVAEIKRRAGVTKTDTADKSQELTELKILIIRIEELELANRKLTLQMRRMKKLLSERERVRVIFFMVDKKIEELSSLVSFLQKTEDPDKPYEKPTSNQEAIAMRGLEIISRNQLLEHSVRNVERTMLCSFFESVEPKPTQEYHSRTRHLGFSQLVKNHNQIMTIVRRLSNQMTSGPRQLGRESTLRDRWPSGKLDEISKRIVTAIDKALSYAIDVLLMRPDRFDDFVDNELRIFLLDTQKAKRILLDVMLLHPEYVPRTWGGDVLAKRQHEARLEAMEKRPTAQMSESKADLEKLKSVATNAKPFAKTPAEPKGAQHKSPRQVPSAVKNGRTPAPRADTKDANTSKSGVSSAYFPQNIR
ncbi:hypothetical protein KIN20_021951 [Parelaphostrongylus tenuis]|uniref:DUF7774 domain-containing protein n=1 Tax=Parelaphostrongylus tenuis TaxID=148309 RepID=A0AAD5MPK0_PARTN|nr:hypothetical protein KIN20_021951 [Parelaphostrongylus tenuis]